MTEKEAIRFSLNAYCDRKTEEQVHALRKFLNRHEGFRTFSPEHEN
jgi:hypothetical protein